MIELIDKVNPEDTLRLQAGVVKVTCDSSSGIGSIITATTVAEFDGTYGDFTVRISGEENW
jgi:heterodisulfide reductase subunit A-like polyferredoxin